MVRYIYDAWGNHAVVDNSGNDIEDLQHIGNLNPFRYRGYYYDTETGLYYLQTRYYDPELCRFISQDSIEYAEHETVNGLNLFAYCGHNPVMGIDPLGNKVKWWQWVIGGVVAVATIALAVATMGAGLAIAATLTGAAVGALYGGITASLNGQNVFEGIGIGILSGICLSNVSAVLGFAATNGAMSVGVATAINFGTSAVIGGGAEVLSQISASGNINNWKNVFISAIEWGILNSLNFGLGYLTEISLGGAFVGGYVYNVLSGVLGQVIDLIKSGKIKTNIRGI